MNMQAPMHPFPAQPQPFQSPSLALPSSTTPEGQTVELARTPLPIPGTVFGMKAPGLKLWSALAGAQAEAQTLEEQGEVKIGSKGYSYAGIKQYIREARRVLHKHGLIVLQMGTLSAPDSKGRRTGLAASYLLVHTESNEAVVFPFEYVAAPTEKMAPPKATGAAYSNGLRYFLRGLLLIATGDQDDQEAAYDGGQMRGAEPQPMSWDPPPGAYPQGPPPQGYQGHQGPPQGAPPPYQGPPHGQLPPRPQGPPPQHQHQGPPPQGQGWGDQQTYQGGHQAPFVDAPRPAPNQERAGGQQSQPEVKPAAAAPGQRTYTLDDPGPAPSEPQTAEEWARALIDAGWAPGLAEDLARAPRDEPIHPGIGELLHAAVEQTFGGNVEAARAAWAGTGFTPNPSPKKGEQRPIPTGQQALQYALKIKTTNRRNAP